MVKAGKVSQKSINISKGIILTFFTIYLIIFGLIMNEFSINLQNTDPESYLNFLNYIPLLCYIAALFCGIGFIIFIRNATTQKARETQSRKKIKAGSIYKQALFLIIFIFAFIPLLSPIIDQGENTQNFSVYNRDWNGCYDFKKEIEKEGYTVKTVQSSLSATERLDKDKSILLILMGPNQFYDPIFEFPFFIEFFKANNSLFICHDHGSTSTLLWEITIASIFANITIPLTIFPNGILRDNASYDTTPEFPIIKSFHSHPITLGINEVILSRASCAVGGDFFGWESIGDTTDYAFIDKDGNKRYNSPEDDLDLSFMKLLYPPFENLTIRLTHEILSIFLAQEIGEQRTFVSADASLFNNELIHQYDNMEFGKNIIEWLTYVGEGKSKDDWIVVFDEAHIRPEYSRDLTSAGIFGFIMQYIIHLSTNPITAWIYPLLAYLTLRKYLPKKDKKDEERKIAEEEEKKEEMARFRTSSFFAQKIEEYKDKMKYGAALKLLYRRLERKLNSQLGGQKITTQKVIDMVVAKDPTATKLKIRRLTRFMDRMLAIKEGKYRVKTEQDFENLFYEMGWAVNNT